MKIIGHRGAGGLAPENTIASLRKALERQVDRVEFDLRVTGDGVVISHHNSRLVDASGTRLKINSHSCKELRAHKPDLVTFEEILEALKRQVPLMAEVKPGESIKPIVTIIKKYLGKGWQVDDFQLGSSSQKTLLELHAALPEIQKVVIEKWSGVRAGRRARQLGTKQISMNQRWLWWGFIRSVSRSGWELYPYTLNNPAKARRWARWGIAGVVTDYPDRFQQ